MLKLLVASKSPTTKFIAGPDVASTGEFLVKYVVCQPCMQTIWEEENFFDLFLVHGQTNYACINVA